MRHAVGEGKNGQELTRAVVHLHHVARGELQQHHGVLSVHALVIRVTR
jgi:hypothetical protein